MLWQGTTMYFPEYDWFFAILMVSVILAIYQKSKHNVPEASHIAKKEPAIESEGQKCCIGSAINGGNNCMATKQDMRTTDVSAQPINGAERKNGENKVGALESDGTNGEKRFMILLNTIKVSKENRATCITTAEDLEAKKLKRIKTGVDANSSRTCTICNILCNSDKVFASHIAGEKHMVRKKSRATCIITAEDLEAKKLKLIKTGLDANSIHTCTICNIVCNSHKAFASHVAGEKHMVNSKGLAQVLISQEAVYSANASNPDKEQKKKKKNMLSAEQAPTVAQSVYCDICKVTCYTQEIYNSHVAGQKHNKKIKNLSMGDRPFQAPATDDNDREHVHASSQKEAKPIGKSKSALKKELEMKKRNVLHSGAKGDAVKVCHMCNVVCNSPTVFQCHCRGKKHRNMVKKQEENFGELASVASAGVPTTNDNDQGHMHASSQLEPKPKMKGKSTCKEDIEMKKRKLLESGAKSDAVKVCTLCNVVCNSATDFEYHCRVGAKHKSLVKKQRENFWQI